MQKDGSTADGCASKARLRSEKHRRCCASSKHGPLRGSLVERELEQADVQIIGAAGGAVLLNRGSDAEARGGAGAGLQPQAWASKGPPLHSAAGSGPGSWHGQPRSEGGRHLCECAA